MMQLESLLKVVQPPLMGLYDSTKDPYMYIYRFSRNEYVRMMANTVVKCVSILAATLIVLMVFPIFLFVFYDLTIYILRNFRWVYKNLMRNYNRSVESVNKNYVSLKKSISDTNVFNNLFKKENDGDFIQMKSLFSLNGELQREEPEKLEKSVVFQTVSSS